MEKVAILLKIRKNDIRFFYMTENDHAVEETFNVKVSYESDTLVLTWKTGRSGIGSIIGEVLIISIYGCGSIFLGFILVQALLAMDFNLLIILVAFLLFFCIFYARLGTLLNRGTIKINSKELQIKYTPISFFPWHTITLKSDEVTQIYVERRKIKRKYSSIYSFSLYARTNQGKDVDLTFSNLDSYNQASFLEQKINEHLNTKNKT